MSAWELLKKALFCLEPERAHMLSTDLIKFANEYTPQLLERVGGGHVPSSHMIKPNVFGLNFLNHVGLAAGFDKNAELVSALPKFGFGFCEIGTVTPRAQAGNPRPRLLREPSSKSLFNRMGFNNHGAAIIAKNLEHHKATIPTDFRVGVNIGKNKDSEGLQISRDYGLAAEPFLDLADFFVINVSSPNTPGLRSLQQKEHLLPIVESVKNQIASKNRSIPLLIKLAPEIKGSDLIGLLEFFESENLSGVVLCNTLAGEASIGSGGWSGQRVKEPSIESLELAAKSTKLPIVSVGGIDSAGEAVSRLNLGASLVEIYSSWIFEGPTLPGSIASGIYSAKLV